MSGLQDIVRKEWVKSLVMKNIFCPVTEEVLDVRTCVVLVDSDGDPRAVMSQAGWVATDQAKRDTLEGMGYTVDLATVKA